VIRNPTTKSFRFMTAAALLAATSLVAAAQSGSSTLSGSVVDSSGAPVPNGAVALINKNTAAKFEVRTDDRGQFQFVPLPADAYTLEVSMPGFKKASAEVTLSGKSVRHDITLQLGSLSETVNIVGGPGSSRGPDSGSKTQELDMARSGFQRDLKACVPSSAGGRIRPPRKIKDVRPVYPENLQAAGVAGTVVLSATIGTDGMVKDAEVLKSAHPDLDLAAIEAVRQWQFDGTLLNCVPSEVTMNVSLNFNVK
jgi:TonB family protein